MSVTFDSASSEYLEWYTAPVSAPAFTICAWIKTSNLTNNQAIVQIQDKDLPDKRHRIAFRGATAGDPVQVYSQSDAPNGLAESTTGLSSATWHCVVGVFTGNANRTIYLDGGSSASNTTSIAPTGMDSISIGRNGDSTPSEYFDGKIAEVCVWNSALSPADIASLAAGERPSAISPANIKFYAPLKSKYDAAFLGASVTVGGTPTFDPDDHPITYPNMKMILPDGRMFMTGAATYTAQGGSQHSVYVKDSAHLHSPLALVADELNHLKVRADIATNGWEAV